MNKNVYRVTIAQEISKHRRSSPTSATSFWKVSVSRVRPNVKGPVLFATFSSHLMIRGVETLNGRFPMM